MSNTIRKSIFGMSATAALVFAPVGTIAMADDVVDNPATDEVTEEVESTDSSDEVATDDSVEAEVIEEAPATEDTDTETEVVEEQSAPQEDPEPVKAEDAPSQPAQEGSDSQESTSKKESAPAETSKGDKASQESAPEKAQPKSDAESKGLEKTVVQDDPSTSTTSSDDTPDVDEPEATSDQEDDGDEGDDGTEEDSFTNVAYNHRTDHQNQVLYLDILYEYSEANDTTGWKIDLMTFDENRNPIMIAEGVQLPPAGETLSFSLAEYGPGIYNWHIYYKSHDNMRGGFGIKLRVPATPVGPTQDREKQELIIPEDDNFDYFYTNAGMTAPIGSGTHWIGSVGEVVVTAKIKLDGVVDQNATTEWTFNFVESGNPGGDDGDGGDDNTPEVTVITPDKGWLEHIQNPGKGDDDVKVRGDYQGKVLVAAVEHHDGRVDVVLVPKEGYAFPDEADQVTISFPEFVEDDSAPKPEVITPDKGWLEHIQNPGKGDDEFKVKGDFADKVMIAVVDSDNAGPGKVNLVLVPREGYAFPDGKESKTLTYDEFVEPSDPKPGTDPGDDGDDDNSNGGDNGSGNGGDDSDDLDTGSKDDDSDDSDSGSKGNNTGSNNGSNGASGGNDSGKTDDKAGGKNGSDSPGKKGATSKGNTSGQSGDKSDKLNQGFSADTGVDEFPVFAPVAGAVLLLGAAVGAVRRYRLQQR